MFGYIALGRPNDSDVPALELSIYLEPGATGRGRGQRLVREFAVISAKEGGVEVLTGTPHTEHAAALLESCGFQIRKMPSKSADPIKSVGEEPTGSICPARTCPILHASASHHRLR